jgi:hypothetical protein
MSQETATQPAATAPVVSNVEKKPVAVQELVESLRSIQDDIGQISELTSEEKLLVAQFFTSFLNLMAPLASAIPVTVSALPPGYRHAAQAYVDPTGHLAIMYNEGHMELESLEDEDNRELMIAVIEDVMPKFKSLTAGQKRKIENRIKFLTAVTKEVQKISETFTAALTKTRKRP